jgi:hypothetical protein
MVQKLQHARRRSNFSFSRTTVEHSRAWWNPGVCRGVRTTISGFPRDSVLDMYENFIHWRNHRIHAFHQRLKAFVSSIQQQQRRLHASS